MYKRLLSCTLLVSISVVQASFVPSRDSIKQVAVMTTAGFTGGCLSSWIMNRLSSKANSEELRGLELTVFGNETGTIEGLERRVRELGTVQVGWERKIQPFLKQSKELSDRTDKLELMVFGNETRTIEGLKRRVHELDSCQVKDEASIKALNKEFQELLKKIERDTAQLKERESASIKTDEAVDELKKAVDSAHAVLSEVRAMLASKVSVAAFDRLAYRVTLAESAFLEDETKKKRKK